MKLLSGLDGAFLSLETPATPMHVASLHLLELPPGYRGDFPADIRRLMGRRLHLAPILEHKLAAMPLQFANPAWVRDDAVDLDYHVQHLALPAPGDQATLEDCVAGLHGELLDRARPLWRLWVIDGLASGHVAYYVKVHHAMLDGLAGVLLAQVLFDVTPTPRTVPRRGRAATAEHPGMGQLAAAALRHDAGQVVKFVRRLPEVARTLAGLVGLAGGPAAPDAGAGAGAGAGAAARTRPGQNFAFGPSTVLNVTITGARRFAGLSLPLESLKQIARAHDAKLNDIVLALASGALRRYLAHHGGIPKKPLIAAMPISLRARGNTDFTTQATLTLVNLHTHVADPIRRLHAIRDAAGAAKLLTGRADALLPTDFPSLTLPWILHGLASLYGRSGLAGAIPPVANLIISNVPGPQVPLYAAGARMSTYWPLSIPEHGLGVNLTVMSYAGSMGFGVVAATVAVPDARAFTRALREAFEELVEKSKVKPRPRPAPKPRLARAPAKKGVRAGPR